MTSDTCGRRIFCVISPLLGAVVPLLGWATIAEAQDGAADATKPAGGIVEIVVTAQKRSQNQQDVPISMTAITPQALQANRITSVVDLATAVPNLASRSTSGGSLLPAFTMRGVTSYGVVPGADKELSLYIDGVYIASTVGSALDLPDVAQIEVLRGPQGTLFGRNATVGAINVITRDPPNQFGVSQDFSYGNYNEFRSKTRIDTGSFGDFSATASFVHDERRGDIRNLGAGTVWTFPASAGVPTTQVSPKYLGDKNQNTVFAAVKYEPSSDLKITNKFDWTENHYTPVGASVVGVLPEALGAAGGGFFSLVLGTQPNPVLYNTTGKRPSVVNNAWTTPGFARDWGDSLIAEYRVSSHLSFKNIVAYRASYLRTNDQIDGIGGLTITPALAAFIPAYAPIVGSPFLVLAQEQVTTSKQWSEEFQTNYNSRLLTLTAGFLYFHLRTQSGGPPGLPNDITLSAVPFYDVGQVASPSVAYNKARSIAGYVQAEVHVLPQVDLVGGVRVTNDRKSGTFVGSLGEVSFTYDDTEPSFSAGVNYKPTRDMLLYAKYSTAFVSGGAAGPVTFKPEKAKSWEAGLKSEWFDHRLRANLALFDVKYTDLQSAQAGITLGHPELGLAIADQGNARAKGFEFESTAVPVEGVTLGGGVGYTDIKFTSVNPILGVLGVPGDVSNFLPTLQPKWTANLSGQYETPKLFEDATLTFQINAAWRDKELIDSYTVLWPLPAYASIKYAPATWLVNGRIALDHIRLPMGEGEIAVWAKNLTDDRTITFPDILGGFIGSTEFQPARTYGLDVSVRF